MIDHTLTAFPSGARAETILRLEITDDAGRRVAQSQPYGPDRRGFIPADLLILSCGSSIGWIIPLETSEWQHDLRKGRYRIRGRIENRSGSYFAQRPRELERFIKASGLVRQEAVSLLEDFTAVSDAVEFEVQ